MIEVYAIKQVHIRRSPVTGATVTHAPAGSILRLTGKHEMARTRHDGGIYGNAPWVEVEFTNFWRRKFTGWTYEGWLENIAHPRPIDPLNEVVPIPDLLRTQNPNDAQQYLHLDDVDAKNLCPHFCVAFAGGDSIDILLGKARALSLSAWEAGVVRNVGLGISALEKLIKDVYRFETLRFADGLHDDVVGTLVSPGKMREMLESGWMLIAGVKINGATGKLISHGRIGHWVVLTYIQPYGVNDGQVKIYNPFPNQFETHSYGDFMASMKAWDAGSLSGLWVPSGARFHLEEPTDESRSAALLSGYADRKIEELDAFVTRTAIWIAENIEWTTTQKAWIDEQKKEMDL